MAVKPRSLILNTPSVPSVSGQRVLNFMLESVTWTDYYHLLNEHGYYSLSTRDYQSYHSMRRNNVRRDILKGLGDLVNMYLEVNSEHINQKQLCIKAVDEFESVETTPGIVQVKLTYNFVRLMQDTIDRNKKTKSDGFIKIYTKADIKLRGKYPNMLYEVFQVYKTNTITYDKLRELMKVDKGSYPNYELKMMLDNTAKQINALGVHRIQITHTTTKNKFNRESKAFWFQLTSNEDITKVSPKPKSAIANNGQRNITKPQGVSEEVIDSAKRTAIWLLEGLKIAKDREILEDISIDIQSEQNVIKSLERIQEELSYYPKTDMRELEGNLKYVLKKTVVQGVALRTIIEQGGISNE